MTTDVFLRLYKKQFHRWCLEHYICSRKSLRCFCRRPSSFIMCLIFEIYPTFSR